MEDAGVRSAVLAYIEDNREALEAGGGRVTLSFSFLADHPSSCDVKVFMITDGDGNVQAQAAVEITQGQIVYTGADLGIGRDLTLAERIQFEEWLEENGWVRRSDD